MLQPTNKQPKTSFINQQTQHKSTRILFCKKRTFERLQQEKPSGVPTLLRLVYNQE